MTFAQPHHKLAERHQQISRCALNSQALEIRRQRGIFTFLRLFKVHMARTFFLFFVVQHILHNNSRVQKRGKFLNIRGFLSKIPLVYTDICPGDWDLVNLNRSCLSRHNVDIYSKDLSVNANISLKNVVMLSFALGENVNNAVTTHW